LSNPGRSGMFHAVRQAESNYTGPPGFEILNKVIVRRYSGLAVYWDVPKKQIKIKV